MTAEAVVALLHGAFVELALFAGFGFLIGGVNEVIIDTIWLVRSAWRRVTVYRRNPRCFAGDLPQPGPEFRLAVFVPAWDEANVIGKMLEMASDAYAGCDTTIFVGCYPNDRATIEAARRLPSKNIIVVISENLGPTSKADCLNTLWRALQAREAASGTMFSALCLHDAEDLVSSFEATVAAHLLPRFGLIQFPVVPLVNPRGPWISGHYCDEFAEAHGKALVVREAIGASLPLAGVGCVLRRDIVGGLAERAAGAPFDADSLTEDYETGLRVGATGAASAFVRMLDKPGGELVATRAFFPATLDEAVRQKARWIIGIAIAGWDRIGWGRGIVENWMRLRDRQGLLAALVLCVAYFCFILGTALFAFKLAGLPLPPLPRALRALIEVTTALLFWRLAVRAYFVWRIHGWREALRATPRALLANVISIRAAGRAITRYIAMARGGVMVWDKTDHHFPERAG